MENMIAGATTSLRQLNWHLNTNPSSVSFLQKTKLMEYSIPLVSFFGKENGGEFSVSVFRDSPRKTALLTDSLARATRDFSVARFRTGLFVAQLLFFLLHTMPPSA